MQVKGFAVRRVLELAVDEQVRVDGDLCGCHDTDIVFVNTRSGLGITVSVETFLRYIALDPLLN